MNTEEKKLVSVALDAVELASDSYVRLSRMLLEQVKDDCFDPLKLFRFVREVNRRLQADVRTMRAMTE